MEIGTLCWCFDVKGTDDDFPDDLEANGVWRMAQITRKSDVSNRKFVLEANYTDLNGTWQREYADNLINATDLDGCKLRNVEQGAEGGDGQPEVLVDDLITLPHLHEAAILHNLAARHADDIIYTMTGPILLAVNPFKRLGKEVYGPDVVERYHQAGIDAAKNGTTPSLPIKHEKRDDEQGSNVNSLGPHVFLLADASYRAMAAGLPGSYSAPQEDQPINQSILVSGESGAGKTETTKFIMQYLATVAGTGSAGQGIEKKVLQSNPVLEAFGNARTIRNDNSSRFGKFIEIHFHTRDTSSAAIVTDSNKTNVRTRRRSMGAETKESQPFKTQAGPILVGAAIQTYLLEKVRLVAQQEGERNYHVFYELVAGASPSLRQSLRLPQALDQEEEVPGGWMEEYKYVNQSGCYERHDHVDDAQQFRHTALAMKDIGLNRLSLGIQEAEGKEEEGVESVGVGFGEVLKVVAAVLHLGNLTFESYVDEETPTEKASAKKSQGATAVDAPPLVKTRAAVGQAAVLLARNGDSDESNGEGPAGFALAMTAELLGVDPQGLSKALCSRKIEVNGEEFTIVEEPRAASHARDGASKVIYNNLFLWLVQRINHSLSDVDSPHPTSLGQSDKAGRRATMGSTPTTPAPRAGGRSGRNEKPTNGFIGVLDIFGFESFRTNSFEQLCINFANEKLQQQFNGFIFELEQQVYEQEEILWSMVDFPDNSACLELIERKHTGVLALLDEQCVLMSRSSDKGFASQLYEFHAKSKKHPNFRAGAAEMRGSLFIINHYAGEVCYDTEGFLEKNVDKINPLVLDLLATSSSQLVTTIAAAAADGNSPASASPTAAVSASGAPLAGGSGRRGSKASSRTLSVGSQFKGQLNDLLVKINATRPHFVRCIKPNDRNEATLWHGRRVLSQLRCGGVLEAVRVSRAGYPNRLSHDAFIARYRLIKPSAKDRGSQSSRTCALLLLRSLLPDMIQKMDDSDVIDYDDIDKCIDRGSESLTEKCKLLLSRVGLQLGRSKVFMRMLSFTALEQLRIKALRSACMVIQTEFRRRLCMWRYKDTLNALLMVTKSYRGYKGRQLAMDVRRKKAATKLACFRRRLLARRYFLLAQSASSTLCLAWRCYRARERLLQLKQLVASKLLCNWWRYAILSRRHSLLKKITVYCQCKWRQRVAKKKVKQLKLDAKNLDSVAAERDALKLKLQEMERMMASTQQGANAMIQENASLKQRVEQVKQQQQHEGSKASSPSRERVSVEQSVEQSRVSNSTDDDSLSLINDKAEALLNQQLMLQAAKAEAAERRVEELERALSASIQRSEEAIIIRERSSSLPAAAEDASEEEEREFPMLDASLHDDTLNEDKKEEDSVQDMSEVFLDPEGEWCPGASTPLHVACTVGDVELVAEFLVVAAKSLLQFEGGADEDQNKNNFTAVGGSLPPLPASLEKLPQGQGAELVDENSDEEMDVESRFARLSSFSFSPWAFDGVPDVYDEMNTSQDNTALLMCTTCLGHILTLQDADGRIALHAASQGGHDFIVKALVTAAASTSVEEVVELSELLVRETFASFEMDPSSEAGSEASKEVCIELNEFPWEIVVAAAKTMAKTPTQREYAYLCSHRGLLGSAALADVSDIRGDTSLHLCRTEIAAIKLLEHGANPNLVNKDGQTPLHVAIRARNVNLISRLLIGGADPHIAEHAPSQGWSSLLLACSMPEALGLVKPFFTSTRIFLDLSKTDRDKNTALHICCRYGGSLSLAQEEASKRSSSNSGGGVVGRKGWRGGSGQKESASRKHTGVRGMSSSRSEVDEKLNKRISESVGRGGNRFRASSLSLENKISPNKRDSGDIEDRELGVLRTIQLLLSHGADPNAINSQKMRPLHDLVNNIFLRELTGEKIKPAHGIEDKPLHRERRGASDAPAYEPQEMMVSSNNQQNNSTPSTSGSLVLHACAVTLLGSHADASPLDCFESSPLLDAARVGDLGLCELLVRHGANLNHLQPRVMFDKMLEWRKESNSKLRSSVMLKKFKKADLTTPIWQRLGAPAVVETQPPNAVSMLPDALHWLSSENATSSTTEHDFGPFVSFYELCASQSFLKSVLRAVNTPPPMVPDAALKHCMACRDLFSETRWRHHCRLCARLLCHSCSSRQCPASAFPSGFDSSLHPNDDNILTVSRSSTRNERVCDACYAVLSLRVVKQQASKPTVQPDMASSISQSPTKTSKTAASLTPTRRMRRGSAPDGSSVFQSLLSPGSEGGEDSTVKLSPSVPPPRPPEDKVKKTRSPFFRRTPSKKDTEINTEQLGHEDEDDVVRNFSMLDDSPSNAATYSNQGGSEETAPFSSLDDPTGDLTVTNANQASGSIFNRLSESLTRITTRGEGSSDTSNKMTTPKKRNLRDLMKSKKTKEVMTSSELDEEQRGGDDGTS